jgi:hydroxymethylglutaryl-CoA reductase
MKTSRISGFYKLSIQDRIAALSEASGLSREDLAPLLDAGSLPVSQAMNMIENVIGTYALPLGVALNFRVNEREVFVPMAVEEPSIVAGVSYMAKLAREGGGFFATVSAPEMIGQIQILEVADIYAAKMAIYESRERLLAIADESDPVLKNLGGGARALEVRVIEDSPIGAFLVVHLIYDVRDAMGANAVNTACEMLAPHLEKITGGRAHLRILSNLSDRRLARARCLIPANALTFREYEGERVRDGIIEAWAFAAADPYRAATHNKGIMNGIDAVLIATGNDWRAVEAGAHAYAARKGRYTSLSTWEKDADGNLVGTLELPLAVGIVGGATKTHPAARAALQLMNVRSAKDIAEILVSVGLAQNLAALRALATEGIQRGHMALHARQVALAAGARDEEVEEVAARMTAQGIVRSDAAEAILKELRASRS